MFWFKRNFLKGILFVIFIFSLLSFFIPMTSKAAGDPGNPYEDVNNADVSSQADCLASDCKECPTPQQEAECRRNLLFNKGGYTTTSSSATVAGRIGVIVDTVMSITGIVFLAIVVFSGIQWMTAGGNEEAVAKAKKRIVNATIGLAVVVGAWAAINFVLTSLIFPGQAVSSWGPFSWRTY